MPQDVTFSDVMQRLYFLYKIDRGLNQVEAGDTMSRKQAKKPLKTWYAQSENC
jgi:predicted transcriptional regulator